jgi:hypothetical protein
MAAAGVAGVGIFAAPAMAGTRADLSTSNQEAFVKASSSDTGTATLYCGSGARVIDTSYVVQSVDNDGTFSDVTVDAERGTHNAKFTVSVASDPHAGSNGETEDDNDPVADGQPTSGAHNASVKVYATCLGEKTSEGDRLTFGAELQGPFGLPKFAISGHRHRRLVYNNDSRDWVGAPSPTATVGVGKHADVFLKCPANQFGNFALKGDTSGLPTRYLVGDEPRSNGWMFHLYNAGNAPLQVSAWNLRLVCVQSKTAKQRAHHS